MKPRVAIVTGGNRGLGLAVCRQLAEQGYRVVLGSRDRSKGERAARDISADVHAIALDVDDPAAPARAVREIHERFARIDVLVNNAAIHYDTGQSAVDADWRIVREAFETNLFGAWRMAQAVAPLMRAARWGRIVNVSSESGSLATMGAGTPAYATSKAALNALTRVLAADLRAAGVLVNAVCPGWVATDMGGPGGGSVEKGAASIVWAATLPDSGPTGGFFRHGRPLDW